MIGWERGWGIRRTVATDYMLENPPQLGSVRLGPDLSNIGATRRMNELRDALLKPNAVPSPGFQPLVLRDAQGKELRAIAKHASPWSVQALDENGTLHLIHGDAVQSLAFRKQSWMPLDIAQRLTPDEINNLLAFLSQGTVTP